MVVPPKPSKPNKTDKPTREREFRAWCFTINNYTQRDKDLLKSLYDQKVCDYIVFEEEHILEGEGTPHI